MSCAISICAESAGLGVDARSTTHFQELTELVKGLAVMGELTPRATDAISAYGERLSSLIVTAHFQQLRARTRCMWIRAR